jgi:hypothetical protein
VLQFFSAGTSVVDSKRAITECLENALSGEKTLNCDLLIIYTAMGHNFKDLLSEAHRLSPGAQVVGCTCAGVIGKEGPNESLKALAIMAIKGPKNEFALSGRVFAENTDSYEATFQMATELKNIAPAINMIFFHPSYRLMPYDRAIKGIESVFGSDVPILGGVSVDNMKLISSFQFIREKIFEMGAVMIGFADSTLEVISQANHGFDIIGKPFEVTSSDGNHIFELDKKPAWKSWTERLGMPETTPAADVLVFAPLAIKLEETFHEEYGSKFFIYGALPDQDMSVFGANMLPEGTKLWLTRRNEKGIHEGVERMMVQILECCEGRKPVAVFHADCAAEANYFLTVL